MNSSDVTLHELIDELNAASKRIVVKCIRLKRDEDTKATKAAMSLTPSADPSSDELIVEGMHCRVPLKRVVWYFEEGSLVH